MNLQAYRWSHNPRGLQNEGPFKPFYIDRYTLPRLGWAKLVAGADEYVQAVRQLAAYRITPIVQIYRESMGCAQPPEVYWSYYQQYLDAGCRWFELCSEPNLAHSWTLADNKEVDWRDEDTYIKPLMDVWLSWSERIIALGGYPAFPAMAEIASEHRQATIHWLRACLNYLHNHYELRFRKVIDSGLWFATHPTLLNHFYQEPPGGPSHIARPYYQQQATEGGWHFEYPYDPLHQRVDPGSTVMGGTSSKPLGAPAGLIATGEMFQQLLYDIFQAGPVPVVGTSASLHVPQPGEAPIRPDPRYPPVGYENYSEVLVAMWTWIARSGPPWFFGVTLSDEYAYYERDENPALGILAMSDFPILECQIPDVVTNGQVQADNSSGRMNDDISRDNSEKLPATQRTRKDISQDDEPLIVADFDTLLSVEGTVIAESEVDNVPKMRGAALEPVLPEPRRLSALNAGSEQEGQDDENVLPENDDVNQLLAETAYLLEPSDSYEAPRLLPPNRKHDDHVKLLERIAQETQSTPSSTQQSNNTIVGPMPAAAPPPDQDLLEVLVKTAEGRGEENSALDDTDFVSTSQLHSKPRETISSPVVLRGILVVCGEDGPGEWFFSVGRMLWDALQPTILPSIELLQYIDDASQLTLIILGTSASGPDLRLQAQALLPDIHPIMLTADTKNQLNAMLSDYLKHELRK